MNKFDFINNAIKKTSAYKESLECIDNNILPIMVNGMSNTVKADFIRSICTEKRKKAIVITSDEGQSIKIVKDLVSMGMRVYPYFTKDLIFSEVSGQSKEYEYKRIFALSKIIQYDFDVIVSNIEASLQYTIPPEMFKKYMINLKLGGYVSIDELRDKLVSIGYERFEQVENVGQFAIRGYIIDIFSPSYEQPIRIELFGDEIDTISSFDTTTQRRDECLNSVYIVPCSEIIIEDRDILYKNIQNICDNVAEDVLYKKNPNLKNKVINKLTVQREKMLNENKVEFLDKYISIIYDRPATFFDYFNSKEIFFFEIEMNNISEKLKNIQWKTSADIETMLGDGELVKGLDNFIEDAIYYEKIKQSFKTVYLNTFIRSAQDRDIIKKDVVMSNSIISSWSGSLEILYDDLQNLIKSGYDIIILGGIEKFCKSLAQTLRDKGFSAIYSENSNFQFKDGILVTPGALSSGFVYPEAGIALISCLDTLSDKKKKKKKFKNSKEIFSLSELQPGDLVVHISHGIGKFCGITGMKNGDMQKDYIKIQYAKSDVLYVPVTQLDMVSKYIGTSEEEKIKLDSLSGTSWEKNKNKARATARNIAKDLIKLYSERLNAKGYAFSQDSAFQRDFEASFEYEETDDQLRCISEIKNDMEKTIPMDRLLCGDVGFGKTEVALRAAFKCVSDSKQCAFLAPTTILAWQHFCTIKKRFEKFPINIDFISGFKSENKKKETIKKLADGEIDLIIGTHSLLQNRVKFKDLGLVIIDEEQRFGVAQKEKFKSLKKNVDILTLSATPIPRTLNMAMSGLRDMSSIEEAPQDRYPVQTYVLEHDYQIICDAIRRELRRSGQVYYLHNRVESINQVALDLKVMLPDATIEVAHGKLDEKKLSDIWRRMLENEIDILVCTTIIETGVDIPNVNTIIIDNADCMGLSQLHQLRGRVGRSSRRAYAYFTFKKNKMLSDISEKRLNAIKEFTQFGSGFKIAMRDLQIRGAGSILGSEQHGHMENIGYDLYMQILNEAIALEKGEKIQEALSECSVDLPVDAYIPKSYIRDTNQRLGIYKRISSIKTNEDALDVTDELIDRFGEPPKCLQGLIDVALVRAKAQKLFISDIKYLNNQILLYQKKINMELTKKLIDNFKNRILVNATGKPYIAIKLKGEQPLEFLKYIFFEEKII